MSPHRVDQRDEHEVAQQAAGKHDGGDLDADEVAHAHEQRRDVVAEAGHVEVREGPHQRVLEEIEAVHEELEHAPCQNPYEHRRRAGAAFVAGDEHLGARRAFGEGQIVVLGDDQRIT